MTGSLQTRVPTDASAAEGSLRIEFFGLPGSGKTTISREIYALLAASNREVVFAPEILRDDRGTIARAAAKLRVILSESARASQARAAIRSAFAIRQPSLRDKVRSVFTVATVMSLYSRLARERVSAVLDQGLLQALWSVRLRAGESRSGAASALADEILDFAASSGHVFVSVETPVSVCIQRLASRNSKHSRMQGSGAAGDELAWAKAESLRHAILGELKAAYVQKGVPERIIVVDGTESPIEVARRFSDQWERGESVSVAIRPKNQRRARVR
jgi:thymidylate kinase